MTFRREIYDIAIIGGGINGVALAREAQSRGLHTVLFERGDFGEGASSGSSKLVHGGIRYLESMEFGLVRDAVLERKRLVELAPHLVEEARFLFPICSFSRHGRWAVKIGMAMYDKLAGSHGLKPHQFVDAKACRLGEPQLLPKESFSAYAYSDASMDDARLLLETWLDAEAMGAEGRNYCPVIGIEKDGENWEITSKDRLRGVEIVTRSRKLAFTTGAWTDDETHALLGKKTQWIRPSQGVHLLVADLPVHHHLILPIPGTRRYGFILPFRGLHLVGTTEYEIKGAIGDPRPTQVEMDSIADFLKIYFPGAKPRRVCAIVGVRPLAKASGFSTAALSREHVFHEVGENAFACVGGKYTTYRIMAREFLARILGEKKLPVGEIEKRPFPGAQLGMSQVEILSGLEKFSFVSKAMALRWYRNYGERALQMAQLIANNPGWEKKLGESETLLAGEIHFSIRHEACRTAVDFLRRRTGLYFSESGGIELINGIESILRQEGFDPSLLGKAADYQLHLREHFHVAAG